MSGVCRLFILHDMGNQCELTKGQVTEHMIEPQFQAIRAEWLGWMWCEYVTPTALHASQIESAVSTYCIKLELRPIITGSWALPMKGRCVIGTRRK